MFDVFEKLALLLESNKDISSSVVKHKIWYIFYFIHYFLIYFIKIIETLFWRTRYLEISSVIEIKTACTAVASLWLVSQNLVWALEWFTY